jgi:hypothetical protein
MDRYRRLPAISIREVNRPGCMVSCSRRILRNFTKECSIVSHILIPSCRSFLPTPASIKDSWPYFLPLYENALAFHVCLKNVIPSLLFCKLYYFSFLLLMPNGNDTWRWDLRVFPPHELYFNLYPNFHYFYDIPLNFKFSTTFFQKLYSVEWKGDRRMMKLKVFGRIQLKRVFGLVWTGLCWLKLGYSGGFSQIR